MSIRSRRSPRVYTGSSSCPDLSVLLFILEFTSRVPYSLAFILRRWSRGKRFIGDSVWLILLRVLRRFFIGSAQCGLRLLQALRWLLYSRGRRLLLRHSFYPGIRPDFFMTVGLFSLEVVEGSLYCRPLGSVAYLYSRSSSLGMAYL